MANKTLQVIKSDNQTQCNFDERILSMGPDGGYGWLIVLGAFMVQVTSFGVATSVMQDYYDQNTFKDVPNALLQLSFVGTLSSVFTNCMGPVAQILASVFGVRVVMITGVLFVVVGLEMAGFASQIWHLYLTQGVLFGTGASLIYVTIMGIAPQYFTRRRGVALGMIASGSGIGGIVIPFIMTGVNTNLGPGWTYRVLGFFCLFCGIIAIIFVKERVPSPRGMKKISDIIKLDVIKDLNYMLWCGGSVLMLMGYFIPFFYLPSYATHLGLTATNGSALVAVGSAMNSVGRIMAGILADKLGPVNINVIFTTMGGLSTLLIWRFAYTYGSLMAYAVVFGLFCGSYFALLSPITATILGPEKFRSGLSLLFIFNIISIFGPNIASAIEENVNAEPLFTYKMFSGVCYISGAIVLFILKIRMNRNIFAKV
ncbi:major facilitator superfamily domain-containing protein [Phycomyces nitens]|nr:major facilitator superfamily domain-containing protein [Phycomyces nitens]